MKLDFNGKNIIISGGSGGIGRVIARAFLETGGTVLIISRSRDKLKQVKAELSLVSPLIKILVADVSLSKDIAKIKRFINKQFHNQVDILVNAAGIYGPIGQLEHNSMNHWIKTFAVNVFGTVSLCQALIPLMKKRKTGRIINFSGGGDGPFPNFTAYSASKGAILRFTESLAAELKEHHIFVNAIAPGAVNTSLLSQVLSAGPKKVGKEFYKRSLIQEKDGGISPKKAAELVLFLAGANSTSLTGKFLSAVHDHQEKYIKHLKKIITTDIYNLRRIKPKDRGYDW